MKDKAETSNQATAELPVHLRAHHGVARHARSQDDNHCRTGWETQQHGDLLTLKMYEAGPIKKEPCDDAPPCAKDSELEYAVFGDGIDN